MQITKKCENYFTSLGIYEMPIKIKMKIPFSALEYCISDSLLLIMRATLLLLRDSSQLESLRRILIIDIMVILIKFSHSYPFYFSSLIPKISMFILAISHLTMSNLPWFMDLIMQILMQYHSLQTYFHNQIHPQLSVISILSQLLRSFWKC